MNKKKTSWIALISILVAFTSLIVALVSMIYAKDSRDVSYEIAYGPSELKVFYTLDEMNHHYQYKDTIAVEFMVENIGFGSTVYLVEAITCYEPPNCLPKGTTVAINYNEGYDLTNITFKDKRPISPRSADLISIVYENLAPYRYPGFFDVLVIDVRTKEHHYIRFYKSTISTEDFFYFMS